MAGPLVGLGVFVIRDGKVLLGKRISKHGVGTWAPPGGHLDYGESPVDGAYRELQEETGLHAENMLFLGYTHDLYPQKHYITLMFACVANGEPELLEPDKCEQWDWYSLEEFPSPQFLSLQNFIKMDCPLFHELLEKSRIPIDV